MVDDDYTLAEVVRLIERSERATSDGLRQSKEDAQLHHHQLLREFDRYVLQSTYDAQQESLKQRVTAIEESRKWLVRATAGQTMAFVMAIAVWLLTARGR